MRNDDWIFNASNTGRLCVQMITPIQGVKCLDVLPRMCPDNSCQALRADLERPSVYAQSFNCDSTPTSHLPVHTSDPRLNCSSFHSQ